MSLVVWTGPHWKPAKGTRKRLKARAARAVTKARKACRAIVLERAGWRCERCGTPISDDLPEWHRQRAHVNETVPRSKGGHPTNPEHCEAICQGCHYPKGWHAPTRTRMEILTGKRKGEV